jgi:itaconate CoA-transferase
MATLPLKGLTVVAVEQAVAAPFCTSRLADAGAHVIKIERPEGDFARGYDSVAKGQSSYFVWLNRGKQSVSVDLATPEGKAELERLIASADVVVQNLKPGALSRMGFGPEILRQRFPRLIICSISGYGETGPYAERKAYDLLIQAESGLCSITGGPEQAARVGISVVDIATGATAHAAILEALIGRGITGEGADIRVSMFDVMADWLTVPLLQHEGGKTPGRVGLAHPSIAPYGVFSTRDGREILISIQSEREWISLCGKVLDKPGLPTDPRFASNVVRVANRHETDSHRRILRLPPSMTWLGWPLIRISGASRWRRPQAQWSFLRPLRSSSMHPAAMGRSHSFRSQGRARHERNNDECRT